LKRKDLHSMPTKKEEAGEGDSMMVDEPPASATQQQGKGKGKVIKLVIPAEDNEGSGPNSAGTNVSDTPSFKKPRVMLTMPLEPEDKDHEGDREDEDGNDNKENEKENEKEKTKDKERDFQYTTTPAAASPGEGPVSPTASAFEHDGYTSTDSISKDNLMEIDWRVHQVKTRLIASNTRVTQYWHWLGGNEGFFEHQVLRSVRPPKWSVFKDPYDFHLRVINMDRVVFARGSKYVVIVSKQQKEKQGKGHRKGGSKDHGAGHGAGSDRGDVMAKFKRERTKRRFLKFLQGQGVKLEEVSV
jgi:hypothetical protein